MAKQPNRSTPAAAPSAAPAAKVYRLSLLDKCYGRYAGDKGTVHYDVPEADARALEAAGMALIAADE